MATYEIEQFTEGGNTYKYVDATAQAALANKVDKVTGKGLSTNDFTDTLKTKLDGIESGAQVNPTIDSELSESSENAVQNKVITAAVSSTKTATGNPITLTDAAEINAEEVVASIEPIQDLNGYDKPWVGGAGKNKFNKGAVTLGKLLTNTGTEHISSTGSYSDYIPIKTNTPYYFSHISGLGAFYSMCVYDSDKTFLENVNIQGSANASGSVTFTQGVYIRVNVYQDQLDICQIEEGSTATSYEPYSNICPISGLTSVDVESVGKNLFDVSKASQDKAINWISASLIAESGSWASDYLEVEQSTNYIANKTLDQLFAFDENKAYIYLYKDGDWVSGAASGNNCSSYFSVPSGVKYIRFSRRHTASPEEDSASFQLEKGTQSTTFVPYYSSTTTTSLGRTVYGGTLNVTTGLLTVDRASVDLGTLTWNYESQYTRFYATVSGIKRVTDNYEIPAFISSCYVPVNIRSFDNDNVNYSVRGNITSDVIFIRDTRYTDVTAFKTAVTGQKLVYELATPTTYQLTTAEVALLADYCTVSTNADDLSVEYWVDNSIGKLKAIIDDLPRVTYDFRPMSPTQVDVSPGIATEVSVTTRYSYVLTLIRMRLSSNGEVVASAMCYGTFEERLTYKSLDDTTAVSAKVEKITDGYEVSNELTSTAKVYIDIIPLFAHATGRA